MKIKRLFKRCAIYVGAIMGAVLSYFGTLAIIAHYMNGDERSLILAFFPAALVALLITMKGETKNG